MEHVPTPSQTIGPFFHLALTTSDTLAHLAGPNVKGERIRLAFRVVDGDGTPVDDAMIEIWHADATGSYDPGIFGRLPTKDDGACVFETVKPGRIDGAHAPHVNVALFARGLLKQLVTRVYFAGDPMNQADPVLTLVPLDRRDTLLARSQERGKWEFEIRLSQNSETVFFDV
jgi:protocatechuate 3,4-dioxygenase alpha subunit